LLVLHPDSAQMRLLLVEDSLRLRKSLQEGLSRSGFAVDAVADGGAGLAHALAIDYDVMVLDLMLPVLDGLSVLRQLRDAGRNYPVLILSARDQIADRVRGLELGADDYLIKPFAFDELTARLQALVRRRYEQRSPVIQIGGVRLNTALHCAHCNDQPLALTPNEISLLELLALRRGRVVSSASLEDHLYAGDSTVTRNAIEAHVSALRRKLRAAGEPDLVKTRRNFGYYIE
jgi:two-component system copper resistance phosphate regulon response regulator CusR